MIATSARNAAHQLEEPNVRDMQHTRPSDMSPPRISPSKQQSANNELKPVEQQYSTDSESMIKNENVEESVPMSTSPHNDMGDEDTEEMNSSSSQCSCRMWTCSQCNKAFNSARALKIHEVKQHENMPKRYLKCSHCDEVFEHGNLLQIHMKVHHNIKVRCPQCKDIFDHPKALSMHVKAHNTEPVCPVCGVKFDHDKLLKLHMEHYHKVSKKETATLPAEQLEIQTFQPLANLISPDSKRASESPERRRVNGSSLSPNDVNHREATPSPGREDNSREAAFHEAKNEERNSRQRSQSPQEVNIPSQESIRREMFARSQGYDMYHHRLLAPIHNRPLFYPPLEDKPRGPPPYGMMAFQPPGLRRRLEKRPLGRSHSLPLKKEVAFHDMPPVAPWPWAEANPMMSYGPAVPREKRIDRAVLEAVRNNLKAKLRTVEATLLGEEGDPHHPLSSTLAEYYEHQGPLCSREELSRQYRPSVITPRTTFDSYPFKRKASPNDLEPQEKMRRYEDREVMQDNMDSPDASPSHKASAVPFIPGSEMRPRFHDPCAKPMYSRPFNTRDDLSILKRTDDMNFGDQAKIFIKRGAPRCNRCQQTFSSKMEYLHHLISHREKDGFADETPEEMEFIEGVRRSMNLKAFAMESHHRTSSNTTPEDSLSPGEEPRESQKAGGDDEEDKAEKKVKAKKSPEEEPSPLASQSEGDSMSLGTATCSECKDVFADSMSCRMHIEKRHMKPRCRECGLTFDHKNLLKIHMDCYHSTLDVLQCYYCGMSFKQRGEFLDHLTSHETQEINKDKLGETGNESTEPGGRRRWGRLVASAQLPAEKPDPGTKERIPSRSEFLGTRETLLKSNGKTKLRKAVSLSTYTDMINRNKRSAADFLRDSRAKGDEVIGRETRTRIFLPNFEERKMEEISRFHSAHSTDKELASPLMARQHPSREDAERLFLKRKAFQSRDKDDARAFWSSERPPFTAHSVEEKHEQVGRCMGKKEQLRRLRSAPGGENMRNQHMPLFRKAFVRDEVETLYQLRHKKSLHNAEGKDSPPPPEASDHRSDLVKIERIELNPIPRQHKPVECEQVGLRPNYDSEQRGEVIPKERLCNVSEQESYSTIVHSGGSPKRYLDEPATSVVPPPPLIEIRRYSQNSSPLNICSAVSTDSSPASSRSNSPLPVNKIHDYKTSKGKVELEASHSPVAEPIDCSSPIKDLKGGKRRNSIKKLTKEALINSLSLKRRASAPDLYQMQRDSTEYAPAEKAESPKTDLTASPGSPGVGSDGRASPVETKHHGSRSQQYTPRKQSERDVTCTQCGVSFGHKKLYKIHLDSYHGKPQNHECLQCGSKNFRDKDEFLKHLMAHQTDGKNKGDEEEERKTLAEEREGSEDSPKRGRSPGEMKDENPETGPKTKIPRKDTPQEYEKNKNVEDMPRYLSEVIVNNMSKNDSNDESGRQSPRVNNNAKDSNDKGTTCFTCGKTFENGKQLEQHFSSHASISEDGRFCCVLCGKAFETHRKLEIHSRSHTGFKPHKCEQCGRCFPYYSSYYYHKMTHTKDRPHKCPLCGKGFIQTRYLRSHLRTHKDEQGTLSDEVQSIIQKVELNMNEETDEESIDSPGTAEGSPAYRANDEEAETAEILCSFKRGLNCSAQNSDAESPPVSNSSVSE